MLVLSGVPVETTGSQRVTYLYGHDGSASLTTGLLGEEGTAWAWYLGDGLGSVRQLADGDGDVTLAQGYTPFGVLLWSEGSGTSGYGYTGEQEDASVGLIFLRARYYDPYLARFISKDPRPGSALRPETFNGWIYVGNNPTNDIDPSGLLSPGTIAKSFGKDSFEDVLDMFETNGRWGFLALLLDAQFGDEIGLDRLAPGSGSIRFGLVSLRPDETLQCERGCAMIGQKPVSEYLAQLDGGWLNYYSVPPHPYREETEAYRLNGRGPSTSIPAYVDWRDETESPDFVVMGFGAFIVSVGIIVDRYGNEYRSFGIGAEVAMPFGGSISEGYVMTRRRGPHALYSESEIRDIIEGMDVGFSFYLLSFGGQASFGNAAGDYSGSCTLMHYGAMLGGGFSATLTRWRDKDETRSWDWIDRVGFTREHITNMAAAKDYSQVCHECDY